MSQTTFYPTPTGEAPESVNQQYNQALKSGKFSGTFTDFMKKAEDQGWLNKGIDTVSKIKGWLTGAPETGAPAPSPGEKPFKIEGTTKTLLIIGGILLAGLISYGVYSAVKSKAVKV